MRNESLYISNVSLSDCPTFLPLHCMNNQEEMMCDGEVSSCVRSNTAAVLFNVAANMFSSDSSDIM